MLVLALDTATPVVTAGVVRLRLPHEIITAGTAAAPAEPLTLLAEHAASDPHRHAERLMPLVRAAVRDAGTDLAALDAVVVGLGPGPFTGLRVGIITAAALGDGLDIPVHGVGSHDGVAASPAGPSVPVLVVSDARRREVYVSVFSGHGRRVAGPEVLAPAALPAFLAGLTTSPMAQAGAGVWLSGLDLPVRQTGSVAQGLVRAAAGQLLTGTVPGPLTPLYLRRPDVSAPAPAKSVLR